MAKPLKKRVCTRSSGYVYEFEGKRNWRRSSSEKWATEVHSVLCGEKLGTRQIDGSMVTVFTVGKKIYAVLPHALRTKPGALGRARTRRR